MPAATKAFPQWQIESPITGTGTTVLASNVLLVTAISGIVSIQIGMKVTGPGIQAGTTITGLGTGIGGLGTYIMSAVAGTGFGTGSITITLG